MEDIKLKIQELAEQNAFNANSFSYGYKFVENVQTDELCIRFGVDQKKSISELLDSEIIPSSITIGNQVLKTDVFEAGKVELLACNAYCGQFAGPNSAANRAVTRPLVGGLSMQISNLPGFVGTMGFIGVHTDTQALVGVTNNHVLIQDAFYTSDRSLINGVYQNEYSPINNVYQNGESYPPPPSNQIGKSLRYVPIKVQPAANKVDCGIFSINQSDIATGPISSSVMQAGVAYTDPLPFATTTEINNLLTTNPMLYSSGRSTGPKGGTGCPMRIKSIFAAFPIPYKKQGVATTIYFQDQLEFVKPENDPSLSVTCPNPIIGGDSGSALIADFGGIRKIIGLVFAARSDINSGYANRIDNVASEMGIEAWDGTNKNFVDPASIDYITTVGGSSNKNIICDERQFWQVGLSATLSSKPC
jgi:hypothetical protein